MISIRLTLVLVVLAAVALAASLTAVSGDDDVRVVRIVAERFHFSPSEIRLREGEQVVFELTSDDTLHGFRVADAGLNVTIPSRGRGQTRVLFTAHQKGRYQFVCSRACGAGHILMRGTILVE